MCRRPTRLIAIGASTGGVEALVTVLSRFPANTPPTVVVQHMPQNFTGSFAARLDTLCAPSVAEAWDGAPLEQGRIYVAPGGATHLEVEWGAVRCVRLTPTPPVNRHRPSVDVAFHSIVRAGASGVVAALLTGMGRDGAEGLRAIRAAGGRTIAQDRATCVVFGMPRAAIEIGAVDVGTPLESIADEIFSNELATKEAI
ncbi:CheB methylesterase domain-containing protein [Rubrimonas cliftonensis]|uniref:protein-glutamate methylesterase n=1 Tax=Rubrimonas cliftonensis TaxID=89524 RepID=A0A1H4DSW7_9RHOB|nr:CheB methylesterase domain-containing protein [Rubrimonas cliftonensis]SEA75599.1 two-component system, chemotaxis family, response regulator CheB [Rubrimonas cliftonensis]